MTFLRPEQRSSCLALALVVLAAGVAPLLLAESALPTLRAALAHTRSLLAPRALPPLRGLSDRHNIYAVRTPHTTYLHCVIPKNGCTYHTALMHRVVGEPAYMSHVHRRRDAANSSLRIDDEDADAAARLLADDAVPKYVVVRNPLMRVLSAYLNKVEANLPEPQRTRDRFVQWCHTEFDGPDIDWDAKNSHWRRQVEYCGYRLSGVSTRFRQFRVERPQEYVDYLYSIIPERFLADGWRRLGMSENISFRDFVLAPKTRTEGTTSKFFDYFDLPLFDFLERVYRQDIDTLGYRRDITQLRADLADHLQQPA